MSTADIPLERPPDAAMEDLLPPDVRGDLTDLRHPAAIDVWYGVVWSRLGRGDLAWAWWDQVDAPELRPWMSAERGRALRELGLHEAAERHEFAGLEEAVDIVDVVMLRLSLVADAIGREDLDAALMRYDAAEPILRSLPDAPRVVRQRLRCSWVEVELAILQGEAPRPDGLPHWDPETGASFPDAYAHGSTFHAAKGLLFGGIVHDDGRLLDAAADIAPPILRWAIDLARHDRDRDGALAKAGEAWARIVPPPGYELEAGRTPTARRLAGQAKGTDQPRSEGSSTRAPSSS